MTTAFAVHALGMPILVAGDDLTGSLLDAVARSDAAGFRDGAVLRSALDRLLPRDGDGAYSLDRSS